MRSKDFVELDRVVDKMVEEGIVDSEGTRHELQEVGFSDFAALCSEALWIEDVTLVDYEKWVNEEY